MGASHEPSHPCDDLFEAEGLANVVVGTGVEAIDPVLPAIAPRQDGDRKLPFFRAPFADDVEPALSWKAENTSELFSPSSSSSISFFLIAIAFLLQER
jgi:hypothetical protein